MIFINLLAAGISLEEIDPLIKCGLCKRIRGYVYSLEVHPKTKDVIDKIIKVWKPVSVQIFTVFSTIILESLTEILTGF